MPPKRKLSEEQVNLLAEWVKRGAAWPADSATAGHKRANRDQITDEDRQHWAFQPLRPVAPPVPVASTTSPTPPHPIDAFLDQRLQSEGLTPNGIASTRTLIKRAFFNLTGLPPSYEELQAWTKRLGHEDGAQIDQSAYNDLINDLMSRPAYGEHWARHWLDVVRYGQSNGYERDGYKPHSWRYRDYVVNAFQNDKPYDRFILEQLAGDELPDANGETRTATGFYRLGVWDDEPDDKRQAEFDELDDVMVTIGASFMGMTLGCARCHEHKFDPLPHADYYRLLAFVRNIRRYEEPTSSLQTPGLLPISDDAAIRQAAAQVAERRRAREEALAKAADEEARKQINAQPLDVTSPELAWALGVRENEGTPPITNVLVRGNSGSLGPEVQPGFPEIFAEYNKVHLRDSAEQGQFRSESPLNDLLPSSGRRLALARWFTDPRHPLTARVIVNRVWHYHFGRGLVGTTGDFGLAGQRPTHPELLDWLASDFIQHGWSIKQLHRTIMTSAAFRRSSKIDAASENHKLALDKDPANQWLWRGAFRRLDAESIRDRMLFSTGELNRTVGGREMYPQLSGEVLAGQSRPGLGWEPSTTEQQARRSLYAVVKRSVRDPLLEAFDYSNTTSPLTERPLTTVAPQALMMLHGRFTAERAQRISEQLVSEHRQPVDQLRALYRATLQRDPTTRELEIAQKTLSAFADELLPSAGVISFRPDVSVSLAGQYRQALTGDKFLIGPTPGWTYYSGLWGGNYEGIEVVDKRVGPFALWDGGEFRDGVLRGHLRVDPSVELVTLMQRATTQDNAWHGSAITLNFEQGTAEARERVAGNEQPPTQVKTPALESGKWIPFVWEINGESSRFWIGDDHTSSLAMPAPALIERTLSGAGSSRGRLGFAVWGGQVDFDALMWTPKDAKAIDVARTRMTSTGYALAPGWSRYDGNWHLTESGSWQVSPNAGAKILWDQRPLKSGEVEVEMRMTPGQAHIAGLLLSVSEPKIGADNWYGYEVSLNADNQTVFIGEHRNNYRQIMQQSVNVSPGAWHHLRAVINEQQLLVFVDHSTEPALKYDLQDRLQGELVGLRTWGSEVEYRQFTVSDSTGRQTAVWPQPQTITESVRRDDDWCRTQALATLARALMNLNEFMYVD